MHHRRLDTFSLRGADVAVGMMDRWRVNLLGRFELRSPDGQETALGARKSVALLALVGAATGQRIARDRLATFLWDDMPDAQARGNLRQLLAATRRPAPFLEADGGTIGFSEGMVETDLAAFEAGLEQDTTAALEQAAALYRGDLLEGFSLRDRNFDEWLTGERERLREHAVQLFLRLMQSAAAAGVEPAIRWALRILAVDPIHEPAHRALMELYAAQGRHAAALRQYEQLRETLSRELGTRPEPETDALARRIREDRRNPARPVSEPILAEGKRISHTEARQLHETPPVPDTPSIVVLPFQNLSGDPEQEYFSDGIVEEITTALSRFRSLFVIARNSAFTYKGRAVDVRQVGRELGVRYLLEGSVRKAANRVRITGQLIDAASAAHLWADRFDGTPEDIFDLQDHVTASVVGAISPALEQAEIDRARRKPTESLGAYDYFLRGRAALHEGSVHGHKEALQLFSKAIDLDPEFASAYGMAAYCYCHRKTNGWIEDRERETAETERLARRAIELDNDDAVALSCAGFALAYVVGELDTGVAFIDRALLLNPNLATAWIVSGWVRVWLGQPEVAIEHLARATRLSPLDPLNNRTRTTTAHAHFFAGRYDEAASWAAMTLREWPDYQTALRIAAASYALAGRLPEARNARERLHELDPKLRLSNLADELGPYARPEDIAHYVEGLRSAGLPD
jgi:TolB-like protein/DNA-binding SARP family transcriptional activator/Tfp pilus assembly protein PilF